MSETWTKNQHGDTNVFVGYALGRTMPFNAAALQNILPGRSAL